MSTIEQDRPQKRLSTDPRFSRRRQAVARTRRRRHLLRVSVVGAVVMALWALFWSPLLQVREVEVVGGQFTTHDEVVDVLALTGSENLLRVSTEDLSVRALSLPWVKRAKVDRILPDTIRVKIVERKAAMALSIGAARWTIDREGRVLAAGEVVKGLPTLGGIAVESVQPGGRLASSGARDALAVWAALPAQLRSRVDALFAPTVERITFALRDGTVVRYGAAERLTAKNRVLAAVLERVRREGRAISYIDVRVPTNPSVSTADVTPPSEG